ncbi:hypothetical protein BJY01DRAFT_209465 [Aspergillus pseudoustus]|uniref:F-box domain-containing protein n=1 Tax=Aspergillus pseudoustus TaxID=1810923 RepID=A0ABR4KFN5_9EURO
MVTFLSSDPIIATPQQVLPTELIFQVIESLIPSYPPPVLPPHHVVTRTFLSLCLTSKSTHYIAHGLFIQHCIYLGSLPGLQAFSGASPGCLPECPIQRHTHSTSMYLAPFRHRDEVTNGPAIQISDMFSTLAGSLRRLVLDFPWRGFYPESDSRQASIILARAFRRLSAIEEFVSIEDDLPLDLPQEEDNYIHEAWSAWPRLRALSLNSPRITEGFVQAFQRCPNLTHVVFAKPLGLTEPLPAEALDVVAQMRLRLQRVTFVETTRGWDFWARIQDYQRMVREFDRSFLGGLMARSGDEQGTGSPVLELRYVGIPSVPPNQNDITAPWVRDRVMDATIWGSHGECYAPERQ